MAEGVLGEIAERKRHDVASRLLGISLDPEPTRRSLAGALRRPGARFIMEVKKASPSGHRSAVTVEAAVDAFAPVADAISVLTDTPYFGGSLEDLRTARGRYDGPILAKDFIVDPRQVAEARLHGADAVLAILAMLDDPETAALLSEASRFNMDVIVEVHDQAELERAIALGAPIIGINNRNLGTLGTDLSVTERLAKKVPPDRLVISESGITGRRDVERLASQVDAFLVGSSLMSSERPAEAARALVFGRVKLCGVNRPEDIEAGCAAAFAGFIFVPGSPRQIAATEVAPLAERVRDFGGLPVGVFRDAAIGVVADISKQLDLHAVQLHGFEDADYIRSLRRELPEGCEIWTAMSVGCEPLVERGGDRPLFDNGDGGSGRTFDWSLIEDHPQLERAIIAGGIGAHNARAAQALGAYAIDVGSAVEVRPGTKSANKIAELFDALRPAARVRLLACA
jgi:indole-3-glycerol phosphate synthase/phosphoribosylanthranilate isomerase